MKIGILGGGSIGVAFALQFARQGFDVVIFEPDASRRDVVSDDLRRRLEQLSAYDLLDATPRDIAGRVRSTGDLRLAVEGAELVQECAPEVLGIKRELLEEAEEMNSRAVLASSSSAIIPSEISQGEPWASRFLVAHPGNPPYLIPVIELVPGPSTKPETMLTAESIYQSADLRPVRLNREIEGFIFNRLQGAVLREAYCLVRDGIAAVEDIDVVMTHGLGRRWAVVGPFETADLNVRGGISAHADRMSAAYYRMGAQRGQDDPWTAELVAEVSNQRRQLLPLEQWEERVLWRDRELMRRRDIQAGPSVPRLSP